MGRIMRSWSFRQIVVMVGRGPALPPMPIPPPDPPKRFPPPPRRVWRRGNWGETIALRIILIPLLIAWAAVAFNLGEEALLHLFGQETQGRITGLRRDDHHKGPNLYASYSFTIGPTHFGAEQEVSKKRFESLQMRDIVPVKWRIIRGERRYELAFSAWESTPVPLVMGTLLLSLFSAAIVYGAWIEPYRIARLIREGAITEGIISQVRPNQKNNQQLVYYTFTLPADGESRRNSTSGPNRPLAYVGQTVTVFYDPAKPKNNVAYEFCEFETDVLAG
jgi:hypothetical protein